MKEPKTRQNIESAFAGESMAYMKYMYFAKVCRAQGDEATAKVFEETAGQEIHHAFGHLDLLYPADTLNAAVCLEKAIAGETYEYTEMYPGFRQQAEIERDQAAIEEIDEQIAESKEHAARFQATLVKAAKRFAALAKVEERHANHYREQLNRVKV